MQKEVEIVETLITPNAKTVNDVFQKSERYFIDIYQRDYKWEKSQVETLLKDIELRFNFTERTVQNPKDIKQDVIGRFKPYFLNTFLTCKTSQYVSVVDGQQRLTTFLIILIKLRQLVEEVNKNDAYQAKTISVKALEKLIFEADDFDNPEYYKIYNPNRQKALDYILKSDFKFIPEDETQERILANYEIIPKYYNSFFSTNKEPSLIDVTKLTYYIYYILEKLNIVEIKVEHQENVATTFEVVNDRGLGLNPYEILKGKFLGNLDEAQKEKANDLWVKLQNDYYKSKIVNSSENVIDLDTFFKIYFRAKFAESEADYKKFEGKYHYEIYQNEKILNFFGRFEDNQKLFNWVTNDFSYFAQLYLKIRTSYDNEYLIYNKLLDQNQQYLLIVSALEFDDPNEKDKIALVAKKFDQLHTTLRLLDAYDSNAFQDLIYKLNVQIRNKSLEEIAKAFDNSLVEYLEHQSIISKGSYQKISDLYRSELFKNISNRSHNFSKYILMRIDRYLAELLDKPSYCKESLTELEERFNKNNKKIYGMHLEHIFANNDKNRELFVNEQGVFDESAFNTTRNKLGVVLLLKDKQNLSSGNDYYSLKVEDYATSNIIWNELLVGHIDTVDKKKIPTHLSISRIEPTDTGLFPLDQVELRQREILSIIKEIWAF